MGYKLTAVTIGAIGAIWLTRYYINTPYDWLILIIAVMFISLIFPDEALERLWALFKWTWLR